MTKTNLWAEAIKESHLICTWFCPAMNPRLRKETIIERDHREAVKCRKEWTKTLKPAFSYLQTQHSLTLRSLSQCRFLTCKNTLQYFIVCRKILYTYEKQLKIHLKEYPRSISDNKRRFKVFHFILDSRDAQLRLRWGWSRYQEAGTNW